MTNWCLVSSFESVPVWKGLQRWKRLRFRWACPDRSGQVTATKNDDRFEAPRLGLSQRKR